MYLCGHTLPQITQGIENFLGPMEVSVQLKKKKKKRFHRESAQSFNIEFQILTVWKVV